MDLKEELMTLRLEDRDLNDLTIREVIVSYRKIAKEVHPDRNEPEKKAEKTAEFQVLNNAYEKVLKHLVDTMKDRQKDGETVNVAEECDDETFTKDNFHKFNFPKGKDKSFFVYVENVMADAWSECLEKT